MATNKLSFFLLLITTFTRVCLGQIPLVSYDIHSQIKDTIEYPQFDTNLVRSNSTYFFGTYDSSVATLDSLTPVTNLWGNANFTKKKKISRDYNVNDYPFRTAIKLTSFRADTFSTICSGIMVSNKHILTASHCLVSDSNTIRDGYLACPAYDLGSPNQMFPCGEVVGSYSFQDWRNNGYIDITLLELSHPIGKLSGWVGIGFENNDSILFEKLFHRFSYPGIYFPALGDSTPYNGDTVYYNYGNVDLSNSTTYGITGMTGTPGESGASLLDTKDYISYGVTSFANNLKHTKLTDWIYFNFYEVIKNQLNGFTRLQDITEIKIYPNPCSNNFIKINDEFNKVNHFYIYSLNGALIKSGEVKNKLIDVSNINNGQYILRITTNNETNFVKTIILQ